MGEFSISKSRISLVSPAVEKGHIGDFLNHPIDYQQDVTNQTEQSEHCDKVIISESFHFSRANCTVGMRLSKITCARDYPKTDRDWIPFRGSYEKSQTKYNRIEILLSTLWEIYIL